MKAWENIINTAMLGTDKPGPVGEGFPDDIALLINQIDLQEDSDKEDKFLQKAALASNYRQCGFVPLQKTDIPVSIAETETMPYCSEAAFNVLRNLLDEDNIALLELWLILCSEKRKLVLPEVLPLILDKAIQHPAIQPLVVSCSGNRGIWLSQFNKQWLYFKQLPEEEIWQTGVTEERIKVLRRMRKSEPDKAREWLQQTWPQENAAAKADLIKTLKINSGPEDLPWLETLSSEKSQKVKDEVLALLKQIPGSSIIRQYEALLKEAVILTKEKALFGMVNKTAIQIKLPAKVDESIFKSGIEKLSGPKSAVTDEEYVISQLISFVPPSFWEKQFETPPDQVVAYFEKYTESLLPALGQAISRFNEKLWVPYFLNQKQFYPDFVNLLSPAEQEKYLLKFMEDAPNVIQHALKCNHEWGVNFTIAALNYMANNTYLYNRGFYSQNINLIPVDIISQLDKIEPADNKLQAPWQKSSGHLYKLLTLKQQTLLAFNA